MRPLAAVALAAVALIAAFATSAAGVAVLRITSEGAAVEGGEPLRFETPVLSEGSLCGTLPLPVCASACELPRCVEREFRFEAPADVWETHSGAVEASVRWPRGEAHGFEIALLDAEGEEVGVADSGSESAIVLADELPPGDYTLRIRSTGGTARVEGVLQIEARADSAPVVEILPDLAPRPPWDLSLGCTPTEIARGAASCLRFAAGIGNVGDGPVRVHLDFTDGLDSLAAPAPVVQRIVRTDGSYRERPAGTAELHPAHHHLHYVGFVEYRMHAWEAGTGRGAEVAESRKAGFCLLDMDLAELGLPGTAAASGSDCLVPVDDGWDLRLGPSWLDVYGAFLEDQFVEISGVADGVYELVIEADPDARLEEATRANGEASVLLRLADGRLDPSFVP